mgnify:FL=1
MTETKSHWSSEGLPESGIFLVYLGAPLAGSQVQVMSRVKSGDGTIDIIGSNFAWDCPTVLLWRPIEWPEGKEPK